MGRLPYQKHTPSNRFRIYNLVAPEANQAWNHDETIENIQKVKLFIYGVLEEDFDVSRYWIWSITLTYYLIVAGEIVEENLFSCRRF